jgi:hypothetical protein
MVKVQGLRPGGGFKLWVNRVQPTCTASGSRVETRRLSKRCGSTGLGLYSPTTVLSRNDATLAFSAPSARVGTLFTHVILQSKHQSTVRTPVDDRCIHRSVSPSIQAVTTNHPVAANPAEHGRHASDRKSTATTTAARRPSASEGVADTSRSLGHAYPRRRGWRGAHPFAAQLGRRVRRLGRLGRLLRRVVRARVAVRGHLGVADGSSTVTAAGGGRQPRAASSAASHRVSVWMREESALPLCSKREWKMPRPFVSG